MAEDRWDGQEESLERQIYVGPKGHRYVKAEELFKDPNVRKRLRSADRLAERLHLKGSRESSGHNS